MSGADEDGVTIVLSLLDRRLALCCDDSMTVGGVDTIAAESRSVLPLESIAPCSSAFRSDWLGFIGEPNGSTEEPVDSVGKDSVGWPLEALEVSLMTSRMSFGGSAKVQAGLVSRMISFSSTFTMRAFNGRIWSSGTNLS
jgi:hypothetical protein